MKNYFVGEWDPTTEDSYLKMYVVDDEVVQLSVLDTAGQDELRVMREQYMRMAEGFLLVYSITSRNSLDELRIFHRQILRVKGKDNFPIVMAGNKCDLEYEREVSTDEGGSLAKQFGCPFIETSAKLRTNVDVAFSDLVREIRKSTTLSPNKLDEKDHLAGLASPQLPYPSHKETASLMYDARESGCVAGCVAL